MVSEYMSAVRSGELDGESVEEPASAAIRTKGEANMRRGSLHQFQVAGKQLLESSVVLTRTIAPRRYNLVSL